MQKPLKNTLDKNTLRSEFINLHFDVTPSKLYCEMTKSVCLLLFIEKASIDLKSTFYGSYQQAKGKQKYKLDLRWEVD